MAYQFLSHLGTTQKQPPPRRFFYGVAVSLLMFLKKIYLTKGIFAGALINRGCLVNHF